jgi:hypothetical protein
MPYLLLQFVFSLRKRSFGLFLIRIQNQDLDPESNPGSATLHRGLLTLTMKAFRPIEGQYTRGRGFTEL